MDKIDWNDFWVNYRNIETHTESDLYFQVGKTVNKSPVSQEVFESALQDIVKSLAVKKEDVILEMCCGNGLLTYPLSQIASKIFAFDFTPHLIEAAKKFKKNSSIDYHVGDAKSSFFDLFEIEDYPEKYLMSDSLCYFTPEELKEIIIYILSKREKFVFYLTGVPNDSLKWNFYNTPERKKVYLDGVEAGDLTNNGIARWWKKAELLKIAEELDLKITLKNQSHTNFRMDVLFEKE